MRDGVEVARQAYHYTKRRTVSPSPRPMIRSAALPLPVHDQLRKAPHCPLRSTTNGTKRPPTICRTAQSVHK